ncbi:hypothetical protein [Streptomyces hilarionis]|uniref:hypothetical protein n=1 Tax=Streptomyces hilarionis TaxID=2839954 RepID=UPI00211A0876|nr:hypothetical protein [Streptomyces hilarionis]MCQ9132540.1 hypothetical protein [Streptomyces hilarionis]
MNIDWSALGQVTAVSVGVTVAVVAVFTLGVLGLARAQDGHGERAGVRVAGRAQAVLCFLACATVVAYGIRLIVPQFH